MAPLQSQEYTVGWICALPLEMAAARAMLDKLHERPPEQHMSDQNMYCFGSIGHHNIAVACLPAGVYGTTSAATVAAQMLSSFESIRIGLMVGIGGGIPSKECDIRLGDVVVSKPSKTFGGVVQYDFGKTIEGGQFTRTSSLNKPPQILLNAVAHLEMEHMVEESKIPQFLSEMLAKYPRMRAGFSYQGALNDQLFQADYDHVGDNTCETCDSSRVVDRSHRSTNAPLIHYGIIASGNQVIKHGVTRDRLSKELDVICFEMEAAGLMDNFPCLVIRGICDYADSHKNKCWQQYAAATAAAYAKELLSIIPAGQVEATLRAAEVMKAVSENLTKIEDEVTTINKALNSVQEDSFRQDVLSWLTPFDHAAQYSDFLTRRQKGTGLWLLNSPQFLKWLNDTPKTLFCSGIPGAGKTTMASIVVEHLWKTFPDHKTGIAFLYCSYRRREEQKVITFLSALLKQLAQEQQLIPESVKALYDHHAKHKTRPLLNEVSESLHSVVNSYSRVFVVIDALDECKDDTRKELLSEIRNLQTRSNTKLMATSRFIATIMQEFKEDINLEVKASSEDVERYLDERMRRLPNFVIRDPSLQQLIKTGIIEAVKGMFLLAQLHLDSLLDKVTPAAIKYALAELPKGSEALDKAYEEAIKRIDNQAPGFRNLAKDVLSWITYAQRPLTIEELQHALAVERGKQELNKDNISDINDMVSVCAGLVTVDPKSNIIRLVHYTTQEYFERIRATWVPDAPTNIAIACLTYLSFKNFAGGCSPSIYELWDRLEQSKFLSYAASHWANHVRKVQMKVKGVALPFLKNELLVSASNQASEYCYSGNGSGKRVTGLHLAARFDLQEMLAGLLEGNENADPKDGYGRTPLSWASGCGHEAVVKLLMGKAVDVDARSSYYSRTPLSYAAENGHEAVVKLLLEEAADMDYRDDSNQDLLLLAPKNGHEVAVRLLSGKTVDANSKDSDGRTPLLYAARFGREAVVKMLLEKAVDADSRDFDGRTPLSWASVNGHEAVVKLLLEKAIDVDSRSYYHGQTPLSWASMNGHEAVVKLLLKKAVDVDARCYYYSRTPLSYAADNGHKAVVKLLLEKAADVDSRDPDGRTPLSYAAGVGHEAVVELLLEKAVDADSKDNDGQTPLLFATENGHKAVVKLLLEKAVDVDLRDPDGRTPLSWASGSGHEAIVRLLLEKAVNVDPRDPNGRTPLSYAAGNGHEAVVKMLLEKAVDVDSRDSNSRTPLSYAAGIGHEAVVKLLLEKAVDADSKDFIGRTPLSYAARFGYEAVVKLLLEKAVVVSREDNHGQTPLSWASRNGHRAVVKLLQSRVQKDR